MSGFNVRAHHGLCMSFFEGKGYSDSFTANMAEKKMLLEKDPIVKIVDCADEVCKACPHNDGGVCSSLGKVAGYDSAVLERCGIKSGTELHWKEFSKLVHDNIIGAKKLSEVCGDCQWYSICGRDQ